MSQDINNIENYETRTEINTTNWRPIYEVIDEAYIEVTKIFPENFIRYCKNNSNEPQFISSDVKNNIKRMAMEQSFSAKVFKLCSKDLKFVATDKNKNEAKFNFQGQSARSQLFFDLGLDLIEINFSCCEPDFYKKLFQIHDDMQDNNTFKTFQVPIGNEKCVESFKFQNDAPILKYCKKNLNSCCLSSLASAFANINHNKDANAISTRIENP